MKEAISTSQNKYDFIIAGSGLSGLSLAYKIRQNKGLNDKKLLLIDSDLKNKNDRTWSFWSRKKETFEHIVHKRWSHITYSDSSFTKTYDIRPYAYKMIRGIDFYEQVIPFLKSCDNTDFVTDKIEDIKEESNEAIVKGTSNLYRAPFVFKSFFNKLDFSKSNFVWQHFKGWVIKTEENVFDINTAHFMDFRVEQENETRFFYVMPSSEREALVEIAIFSNEIPSSCFYDPFLKEYIKEKIGISNYEILEEEVGAIPMTDFNFTKNQSSRIINIGTNGGSVKGSSGYAFMYIQKETDRLLKHILEGKTASYKPLKNRYKFYDSIFLNAILTNKTSGVEVFGKLFRKLSPQQIFKFLDEENNFIEDLRVFMAPPTIPFTKAFFEEIRKKN